MVLRPWRGGKKKRTIRDKAKDETNTPLPDREEPAFREKKNRQFFPQKVGKKKKSQTNIRNKKKIIKHVPAAGNLS